jgi:hypothetical protein
MPAFGPLGSAKLKAVLSHLRTLQGKWAAVAVTGNPQRGKSIFFGKARDGKKYEGVTRNEDNFSMQLQSLDGTFHPSKIGDRASGAFAATLDARGLQFGAGFL